ncbi:hypothetical protein FRB98_007888 [Tulasnella sp. 332]|nr:hypothetical protein FRB98_007888 [Tulasnella sp. 332]
MDNVTGRGHLHCYLRDTILAVKGDIEVTGDRPRHASLVIDLDHRRVMIMTRLREDLLEALLGENMVTHHLVATFTTAFSSPFTSATSSPSLPEHSPAVILPDPQLHADRALPVLPSTSNPGSPPKRSTPVNPASLITSLGPSSGTTSPAIKGGETTVDVKPEPVDDAMDLDKPPSPLRQPKQEATPSPPRQTSNANWGKRSHDIKPKIETDGRPVDLIDTLSANSSTAIHPVPTPTEPRRRTTSHANPNMLGPGKAAAHDRNSPRIPSGSSPSHHSKHYVHSPSLDQGASQPSSGAPTPSQQHSPVVPPAHAPPKGPNVKREIPSGPRARGPQKAVAPPLVPSPKPKLIDIPPVVNVWVPPGALERDALEKRLREQQRAYQATLAVEVIKSGLDLDIALVELEASGQKWRMAESQLQRASKGFSLVEEQSSE